ncbi:MAG: DUF2306 domain-containing protein [Phycisphaerae bacterium]|nr:DUF2306 domain-containing protein [Saprospiraceae bacterium]
MKKTLWILLIMSALAIGFYPVIYFFIDRRFGLLSTKSPELLGNIYWNIGFYTHIIGAGIAMLVGWTQFIPQLRNRYLELHRNLGKTYVIAVLLSGFAGYSIAFFATAGTVAQAGFIGLALVWLYTTLSAYNHIRKGRVAQHERMMTYSYATCFAAVTLRIWFPLLGAILQDLDLAYQISAWLCWVPNLLVVRLYLDEG